MPDQLDKVIKKLERRVIDLSYTHKLSHIGSCLTVLPILYHIYTRMNDGDRFVLSCGHSGLGLYVILEHFGLADAEKLLNDSGVHPDRKASKHIHCSTGSLGQGLPIALGMAMADRDKYVYCLISDGEAAEGSIYEALCIKEKYRVNNLIVYCNYNGFAAYDTVHYSRLKFLPGVRIVDTSDNWFIREWKQEAHYRVLTENDYKKITA